MASDIDRDDHTVREREVIVTDRGRSGVGSVVAAILGIIVVGLLAWAVISFVGGGGDADGGGFPDEVDVNVDPDAGG